MSSANQEHQQRGQLHPPETPVSSRRSLLKGAGIAALATTQLFEGRTRSTAASAPSVHEGTLPIEAGFTVIERDGWSFIIDINGIKDYAVAHGSNVEVEILGGYERESPKVMIDEKGNSIGSGGFVIAPKDMRPNGVKVGVLEALPHPESNGVMIVVKETKDGEIVNLIPNFALMDYRVYDPGDDRKRVWSEVEIDPEILREIHTQAQRFDVFQNTNCPTFIFEPRYGIRSAVNNPGENWIKIPGKYFQNPEHVDEGHVNLDHERWHSIHNASTVTTLAAKEADTALDKEHQNLWKKITGGEYTGEGETYGFVPEQVRDHPAFQTFDESTYFPGLRQVNQMDTGHPFSNYRELFASGMNCMSRVGAGIVDQIEEIKDDEDQKQAKLFGAGIINLAISIAGDKEAVITEFPRLSEVIDYFEAA